jgi:hypothetical protein
MDPERSRELQELVRRALASDKLELAQVWFRSSVLDRYREDPDSRIMRTDSAGRLRGPGAWMINFGISPDDQLIHVPIGTLVGIPESQREHWIEHVVGLPTGASFLRMAVNPAACIDDGPSRAW